MEEHAARSASCPRCARPATDCASTPPTSSPCSCDPDELWPELADMIDSGLRLVVFAERADGPAPWYRNFHRYGMETPFAFRTPRT